MSTYIIDHTDPLTGQFSISPGGFNGPGGTSSNSTLRLHGRGALEWGEAVDENMLRLAENFAGATAPLSPVGGQLWYSTKFYYHDANVLQPGGWYRYDPTSALANKWSLLNGTGIVATSAPPAPAIGNYYFSGGTLYRNDTAYKQADVGWLSREFTEAVGDPTVLNPIPEQNLLVYDKAVAKWVAPVTVRVTNSAIPPTDPQRGVLWYDSLNNTLSIWDGITWTPVVLAGAGSTVGDINMGGTYTITGLPVLTYPQASSTNAATIAYVNLSTNVTNLRATLDSVYLNTLGDSMSGVLNMGNNQITNLASPTLSADAATKGYTDTTVSNAISALGLSAGGLVASVFTSGSPTYKTGDICVTGGKIYIAAGAGTGLAPGGNWKQIWPATYS